MDMTVVNETIGIAVSLGERFKNIALRQGNIAGINELLSKTKAKNSWFTEENILFAFQAWAEELTADKIERWLSDYSKLTTKDHSPKTIGVINAGNIPLVGLHDLLCVILSGNRYLGKNASDDPYLLPFVADLLFEIDPSLRGKISFAEKLSGFDAVIATGSNNSARYFDYYFGKYPHIIRMNRTAVALLTGDESEDEYKDLGRDIFQYFGLGCRNVSKLYVPRSFSIDKFYGAMEFFSSVSQHNKYMNNHDYNSSIYLLKKIPFLDNNFLILKEDESIASPVSVLHYEFYDDLQSVKSKLENEKEKIQCIVSNAPGSETRLGQSQHPALWDYADGVDTMKFLTSL